MVDVVVLVELVELVLLLVVVVVVLGGVTEVVGGSLPVHSTQYSCPATNAAQLTPGL